MSDPALESSIVNYTGILCSLVLAGIVYRDIRSDVRTLLTGRNIVLCGIGAWFLLEAVTLSPELKVLSQATYEYGIFCVVLATASFLLVYHRTTGCRAFDPMVDRFRWLDDPKLLWRVVLFCGIVGFAPILYYSKFQLFDLLNDILGMRKSWGGMLARGRYGGFREALLMLEKFIAGAGPFAVILLLDRRTNWFQKGFCLIMLTWPILRAYGLGTRAEMITSIMPTFAVLFLKMKPQFQRRVIYAGLASLPFVYTLMAAFVVSRGTGEFSWSSASKATYVGNEMFQELAFITTIVPNKLPYQMGQSYYVQIVNPIPRFLWKGKPRMDSGILMAQLKGEVNKKSGETYLTRSPGLIGEMYLNFGLVGVVGLSAFGGWLVRGWDRIAQYHSNSLPTMVLYYCGLATLFIMGRSFTMGMFYGILFLLIGTWIVTKASGRPRIAYSKAPAPRTDPVPVQRRLPVRRLPPPAPLGDAEP